MSLTTGEMSAADLAAVVGNNNDGMGFGGNGAWWIILLFLILFNGNNGWGGNNGGMNGLYPWMNQADITNSGFRDQFLNDNIMGIRDGIAGISTQLCNGFSNVQMSGMQNAFGLQNAINAGFNGTQAQLAQCCCDNRLATCQTQNIIQSESAATRFADANNTRDIIQSQSNGTQAILDKLCQLELDAKNDTISTLRQELLYARGQASQDVQTANLRANQATVANELLSEMRACPIPAQPVYGSQPIFTCGGNTTGCGCGSM
jgi:hypothetical protein